MSEIDAPRLARIEQFSAAMVSKLREPRNVAKADWRHHHPLDLYWMLQKEAGEFLRAYRHERPSDAAGEAVDIANFAFMTWDNLTSDPGVQAPTHDSSAPMERAQHHGPSGQENSPAEVSGQEGHKPGSARGGPAAQADAPSGVQAWCPLCDPPRIMPAAGVLAIVAVVASLLLIAIAICVNGAHR